MPVVHVWPAVSALVDAYRALRRPVVHVVRLYLPDGSNADLSRRAALVAGAEIVHPGSTGSQPAPGLIDAELDAELLLAGQLQQLAATEHVLFKPRWNAFYGTPLDEHLCRHGVDTVVIAGCNYPNCPRGTIFGASERDYRIVVATDAVSGWYDAATRELNDIGVATATGQQIAHQLQQSSTDRQP